MKKVLIFKGGWDGHQPDLTSVRFARLMEAEGYEAEISDTLDCLADAEKLEEYALIVACWTMGEIPNEYVKNLAKAIGKGTGLAGCHGGMCDAFRKNTEWQFITGGQWVSHPGGDGIEYTVPVLLQKGWRILRCAVSTIICMWIRPSMYWLPRVFLW